MKLISILSEAARNCIRRFPVPAAFATALAALLVGVIISEKDSSLIMAIAYFLSVGYVLSLTLTLWSEEQGVVPEEAPVGTSSPRALTTTRLVWALSFLVLLADSVYVYHNGANWDIAVSLMHASAIMALVLTVFFLSFTRERDDIPAWNFALRLILSGVVCWLVGMVLWGGLSLLLVSLNLLFSFEIGGKWFLVVGTLFSGLLPSLLFLGCIPDGQRKHNRTPLSSNFLNGVFRFLFVPLELLYIIVLYVYALQIIVHWELPNGMVSWLVIASMVGLIGIEFGLYPARKAEGRRFDDAIARLLPLIITPLLLLMTVGIVRRFSDYGITIPRLYLATLNGWFYAVCIGLFLMRARRIHWIPITFAALFLLTSVLPLNYATITRRILLQQTEQALVKAGAANLPLDADRYDAVMKTLTPDEAGRISAKLKYLEQTFSSKTIEPLVTQKDKPVRFRDYIPDEKASGADGADAPRTYMADMTRTHVKIPEGYRELYPNVTASINDIDPKAKSVDVPLTAYEEVIDTLVVSIDQLKAAYRKMDRPVPIPTKSGTTLFMADHFNLWYSSQGGKASLYITGFMFK
ncbi:MAG: DUF4153 domain-containing protein [Bacteroidaceae bacterium]|nr:DUF4153 domain-containing protein [Bacteroidaceae bacterium]